MPETPPEAICVEVVYADPLVQITRRLDILAPASVGDAVRVSGICSEIPVGLIPFSYGIWGRVVAADTPLHDGDRVELYRPLKIDPKLARRRRAEGQKEN